MSLLLLLLACLTPETTSPSCTSCHGSDGDPAPPAALGGLTDPSVRGVGAHQSHLDATLSAPVACDECHLPVTAVDAEGHVDTPWPAEVVWASELADHADAAGPWDPATLSCTVYCHGVTLAGGERTQPVWTEPGLSCTSCHGDPPPSHCDGADPPTCATACASCHAGGAADPARHIDGTLDFGGATTPTTPTTTGDTGATTTVPPGCDACHGAAGNPAPPPDTLGRTDTTLRTVGAHEIHVLGSTGAAPVACADCHEVPATVNAPGHLDDGAGDLRFAGVAVTDGATPTWDGVACSNTWCHARSGASVPSPTWTVVDGSQAPCGGCHGDPPPAPHPQPATNCGGCHPTFGDPAHHVDGTVDL